MLSTGDPPQTKRHIRLKVNIWKNMFHANAGKENAGVAILISDKRDFEIKAVKETKKDIT